MPKGSPKKRKVKKKKDPEAPKRGKNGFMFFTKDKRAEVVVSTVNNIFVVLYIL